MRRGLLFTLLGAASASNTITFPDGSNKRWAIFKHYENDLECSSYNSMTYRAYVTGDSETKATCQTRGDFGSALMSRKLYTTDTAFVGLWYENCADCSCTASVAVDKTASSAAKYPEKLLNSECMVDPDDPTSSMALYMPSRSYLFGVSSSAFVMAFDQEGTNTEPGCSDANPMSFFQVKCKYSSTADKVCRPNPNGAGYQMIKCSNGTGIHVVSTYTTADCSDTLGSNPPTVNLKPDTCYQSQNFQSLGPKTSVQTPKIAYEVMNCGVVNDYKPDCGTERDYSALAAAWGNFFLLLWLYYFYALYGPIAIVVAIVIVICCCICCLGLLAAIIGGSIGICCCIKKKKAAEADVEKGVSMGTVVG